MEIYKLDKFEAFQAYADTIYGCTGDIRSLS